MIPSAGVATASNGDVYIADSDNNRVRKVSAGNGVITTVAGTGAGGFSGDTMAATSAELSNPLGVALDASGNLHIADNGNNRVRMVSASTGIITTVAGNGTDGFAGDNGPTASAELFFQKALPWIAAVNSTLRIDSIRVFVWSLRRAAPSRRSPAAEPVPSRTA